MEGSDIEIPEFNVSYKPQKISPKFQNNVRNLLHSKIRDSYMHPQFVSDVMKPLQMEQLMDQEVGTLSGGELQRVALALCLGKVCVICEFFLLLKTIDSRIWYFNILPLVPFTFLVKIFNCYLRSLNWTYENDYFT